MNKYIKIILGVLVVVVLLLRFVVSDKLLVLTQGYISSNQEKNNKYLYTVSIEPDNGFSKRQVQDFTNIGMKNRKHEINSTQKSKLESPNNGITMVMAQKSGGSTAVIIDLDLWLYEDTGYIRHEDSDSIYELDKKEHEVLVELLTKDNPSEAVFIK